MGCSHKLLGIRPLKDYLATKAHTRPLPKTQSHVSHPL
ncbi:hypothetical protein F383_22093 [Gossypium arboreum]|uniref:Uncharacterized protein n=1 Tax=Gossypium arboreum TaxID=29729 RepID=A0A0B0MI72_GOSAR|nr:hypothetical protein F383_22093 [Gossypium arboreum]